MIGKTRLPTVDSRVRRTISDDDDDAERRRPRASRSEDHRNSTSRRDGDVPCKHLNVSTAKCTLHQQTRAHVLQTTMQFTFQRSVGSNGDADRDGCFNSLNGFQQRLAHNQTAACL